MSNLTDLIQLEMPVGKSIKDKQEKILLALLPFWNPLIPPLGISCLKAFLEPYNYEVKTVDGNIEPQFRNIYDRYFATLSGAIPKNKQGNFNNIGMDVMRNQLMAHLNYTSLEDYKDLMRLVVDKIFFHPIEEEALNELIAILDEFYALLETYVIGLIEEHKPEILGISVFDGTLPAAMFAFNLVRNKYPDIINIMGGGIFADDLKPGSPNFDFFMEKTPYIDKIVVGEGEKLFLKVLEEHLDSPQRVFHVSDIEGQRMDIKTAVTPDFSDFDLEYYPHMSTYTSRSCPFMCSFCSETVMWGNYRKKGEKQLVDEMTDLYRKHKRQLFLMGDSLLNPVVDELATEFLKSDLSLYWDGHLRVEKRACDTETTLKWRRGGFYRARMGIESGSQHVLDMMDKKITVEQIKQTLYSLAHAGIKTTTFWVIGHPGETEEDFQETLDLIEEMKDHIFEAWSSPFSYYWSGQVASAVWESEGARVERYPAKYRDMLVVQAWDMQVYPQRELIYDRLNRFVQHCERLGIPTSFSTLHDVFMADERWKTLHKNAVPSLLDFQKADVYFDENKNVKNYRLATSGLQDDGDWGF